jgi:hypothetical protein
MSESWDQENRENPHESEDDLSSLFTFVARVHWRNIGPNALARQRAGAKPATKNGEHFRQLTNVGKVFVHSAAFMLG